MESTSRTAKKENEHNVESCNKLCADNPIVKSFLEPLTTKKAKATRCVAFAFLIS